MIFDVLDEGEDLVGDAFPRLAAGGQAARDPAPRVLGADGHAEGAQPPRGPPPQRRQPVGAVEPRGRPPAVQCDTDPIPAPTLPGGGDLMLPLEPRSDGPVRGHLVALGAHPDDIEIACGGTLLQLAESVPELTAEFVIATGSSGPARRGPPRRGAVPAGVRGRHLGPPACPTAGCRRTGTR